jgi:hypothetical protein
MAKKHTEPAPEVTEQAAPEVEPTPETVAPRTDYEMEPVGFGAQISHRLSALEAAGRTMKVGAHVIFWHFLRQNDLVGRPAQICTSYPGNLVDLVYLEPSMNPPCMAMHKVPFSATAKNGTWTWV